MSSARRRLSSRPPDAPSHPNVLVLDDHTHALQILHKLARRAERQGLTESARRYRSAVVLLTAIDLPPRDDGSEVQTMAGVGPRKTTR